MPSARHALLLAAAASLATARAAEPAAECVLRADQPGPRIRPQVYGHFAEHLGGCIYGGIWVGENSPIPNTRGLRNDVVAALKQLEIPVLRWPGGCFADTYHWRDGIGPREKRPPIVNVRWGGVTENNHFGTHEFLDLCELLGTEPYVCGNVGTGTPQEMKDWLEYMTFAGKSPMADLRRANGREQPWSIPWFGIGNESWGCGGNMRPEYYADLYRQFFTFVRAEGTKRVACGANWRDVHWTDVLMKQAGHRMEGLSLHYYCSFRDGSATDFKEQDWFTTMEAALRVEEVLLKHVSIMDQYDPKKRVGLFFDEWGTWWNVEPGTNPRFLYQQNTLRDALAAALHFHSFHRHADRLRMANIAQTVNVLQAMVLTDGPRMLRTPTYHVFDLYKPHKDALVLPVEVRRSPECKAGETALPAIHATASRNRKGRVHLSLVNIDPAQTTEVRVQFDGRTRKPGPVGGRILTADAINDHNTFDQPDKVTARDFNDAKFEGDTLVVRLPAKSVVTLALGPA